MCACMCVRACVCVYACVCVFATKKSMYFVRKICVCVLNEERD